MPKIKRELNDALVRDLAEAERLILRNEYAAYLDLKQLFDTHRKAAPESASEARARFEVLFTRYYGLNSAGVTEDFQKRFFEILFDADVKVKPFQGNEPNYSGIISELYEIKRRKGDNSFQGSFTSKLIAMHKETLPIYDEFVRAYLKVKLPTFGKTPEEITARIAWFVELLDEIKSVYALWADDSRIKSILDRFAQRDPELAQCDVVRQMDFLVWQAGKLEVDRKTRAREAKKAAKAAASI